MSVAVRNVAWDGPADAGENATDPKEAIAIMQPNNLFILATLRLQVDFKSKDNFQEKRVIQVALGGPFFRLSRDGK